MGTEEGAAAKADLKEQKMEQKEANLKKDAKKALKGIEKDEKLKRPASSYWLWMNANRAEIEKAAGSKAPGAVGAKAGEMWKALPAAAKKPFEDDAAKQRQEYDEYVQSEEGKAAMVSTRQQPKKPRNQF